MLKRVDVALLPSEALAMAADAYVVVDVLRATTTIATLFEAGMTDLAVVDNIDMARRLAQEESRLLLGEVRGLRPDGFDYGNSPVEVQPGAVHGRGGVLFTTNGTTALCALGERAAVYAGAPANATAIAQSVRGYETIAIVCAGTDGTQRFALEDFAAAGLIVQAVQRVVAGVALGDAGALALRIAARAPGATRGRILPSPAELLIASSQHARALKALGFERDLAFCAQLDTSQAAPRVVACGAGWALLRDERSSA